jgi:uncharacterized transporter YbjL
MSDNNTPSTATATAIAILNKMEAETAAKSPLLANMVVAETLTPVVSMVGAIFAAAAAADAARQNDRHLLAMEEERASAAHRRRMEQVEYDRAVLELGERELEVGEKTRRREENRDINGKSWSKPARPAAQKTF